MDSDILFSTFVFLAATCLVVPLADRLRLGSVLGYLIAGVVIGPFGFALIRNPQEILHFAEFGVVMMLFIIGLELEPMRLWRLRRAIIGLGGLQVLITSAAFTALGLAFGYDWRTSLAVSMALSLSSTALVLQMLEEKGLRQTSAGQAGFSVLLFQDIAVILILIIMPLLATDSATEAMPHNGDWVSHMPGWAHALTIAGVVGGIILIGRYLARYIFRFIANTNLREVFTAISLALVVGITLLMQQVGVSPALGAFVAGVVLANSEYRHTIITDIEPFKGLLLGLFFISIGMGIDFNMLSQDTARIAITVFLIMATKLTILCVLGKQFELNGGQHILFAIALAQGGEFAFVLFQFAGVLNILSPDQMSFLTLSVVLSMAATPFLMILDDRFVVPRFMSRLPEKSEQAVEPADNPVVIVGYGRFGQIIGRFMSAQGIKLTILEKDPDQIELLRRFGSKVYFGDASRFELLENAGVGKAKLLIITIDDADKILDIVRIAREHFPQVKILARARNRRHAYELYKAGVDYFRRETFDSALLVGRHAMELLGRRAYDMRYKAMEFARHDEEIMSKSFGFFEREPELINFARQAHSELEHILADDQRADGGYKDDGWGSDGEDQKKT